MIMISKRRDKINPRKKRLNLEEAKGQKVDKSFGLDFVSFMVGNEPTSYREALVVLLSRCKPLGHKWIFKKKMKADGTISKHKARLVIKEFRQREGLELISECKTVSRDIFIINDDFLRQLLLNRVITIDYGKSVDNIADPLAKGLSSELVRDSSKNQASAHDHNEHDYEDLTMSGRVLCVYRDCAELMERVKRRICDWKNKFLSFAGRAQLVRSVLSSMHVYWASVFILPSSLIIELEQLMRGFLWCQGEMKRGKAKVAWEVVCLPKKEGGLGIRRLDIFNKALVSSHIWSLLSGKESLWVKWIHVYKLNGRSFWDIPIRGNMSWGWRKILHVRQLVRPLFRSHIGNGNLTFAWHDHWSSVGPLSKIVSNRDIYSAGFHLNAKVKDICDSGTWSWPLDWYAKYPLLTNVVAPTLNDLPDRITLCNMDNLDVNFSVAAVWDSIRPRSIEVDWFHVVWFSHHIPRYAIHLCLCVFFVKSNQIHMIIYFGWQFSSWVWDNLKPLLCIPNVPSALDDIVAFLIHVAKMKSIRSVVCKLVFSAACYFLWQERNYRIFKKKKRPKDKILELIKSNVRLKLLTCSFKKTPNVQMLAHIWKLPCSLVRPSPTLV
ncbi:hypothetical protein Tco_1121349 [Tanacetum coccineum]|uniref:Reverse transcriptase zinc-binding domain-containing protein n=1 Tax=Tanacetum coccineum TaxID=301880 RepID=A0ABQ5J147_9ASTR